MDDKTTVKISLFEQKVFYMLKIIILCTLVDVIVIFLVQGIARKQFTADEIRKLLLTIVSIVVASIPVAMPIVLQVTMALGAGRMARQFNAICTSLPALQDISSMSILCSDKTGTLTTAKITIHAESVWHNEKFSKEDVALYSALASNRDKKEDPIDRSVINHFDSLFGPEGLTKCAEFTKVRGVGFNPIYKRVVFEFTHLTLGNVTIAKGLAAKVMDTTDGGEDDAADQWKVENFNEMDPEVSRADDDFSKAGYKTLGIAVKFNEGPFMFAGILPMLDPPRHDSARTIKSLLSAGIKVKMITGDHLNIAKETARLVGLGVSIYTGEETRNDTPEKNLLIWNADGFAQVLPRDKREVVDILKNEYHVVVGMTGDGVNDAPAISAAQCGIAVDDATDAAKNAAAIILTSPGLSAVYSAVVESRRIFRKLKAYVTYRFAVSMQIVVVLTLLIFIANCPINSLYIILLALFNDITMLPIAYDRQQASAGPEVADVTKIMILCCILGTMQTGFSLLWAFVSYQTGFFQSNFDVWECKLQAQAGIWLQISIATELLIFSTRAPSFIFFSVPPSIGLFSSVLAGCLLFSLFAGVIPYFGYLHINDIVIIWAYNIICLFLIDLVKVMYLKSSKQNIDVFIVITYDRKYSQYLRRFLHLLLTRIIVHL
jgi:H+-transporting ATPase